MKIYFNYNATIILESFGNRSWFLSLTHELVSVGRDKIRMNWMNPSAPELGPFSPQCAYGSAASNLSVVAEGFHYTYTAGG